MKKLEELAFDNTYTQLGDAYFSRVLPTPCADPELVAFNTEAAQLIDLDPSEAGRPEFLEVFSGKNLLPGFDPVAMVYSGHQFGVRVPRLGDGRAILLAEALGPQGSRWDLHLKGSGETPYSRQGDGRAVLRSSIREYLCGEAMHALGVPTTRTLCILGSPEPVFRETAESRALIVRMAPSHIRFGSFEYFYFRHHHEPAVQKERLMTLADYVIHQHFSEIEASYPAGPERYGAWLQEVAVRTARLIARWQAVGFAHGVMNTDNMSILGLTLDYGPFGFLEDFDPGFICNHSDSSGRYAFDRQPQIGLWNLNVLAQSILPLIDVSIAMKALTEYEPEFHRELSRQLRAKMGLIEDREEDASLISGLFGILQAGRADYTRFFRALGRLHLLGTEEFLENELESGSPREDLKNWLKSYRARLSHEGEGREVDLSRGERMNAVNPKFILRNYLAQKAIDEAVKHKNYSEINVLLELLRRPFEEHAGKEEYAKRPPDWGRQLVVSCSS